jgi:hypothetical protein
VFSAAHLHVVFLVVVCSFLAVAASDLLERPEPLQEFELNLKQPEDNVNGFYAFLASSFVYNHEEIEALVLHKQLFDVEDMRHANCMVVVSLLECGTKLLVEEPAVPHFFHSHVDQMLVGIKQHHEAYRAILTAHVCKMNGILADPERLMRKYILNFPSGVRCKMGYMNPSTGRVLVGSMNTLYRTVVTQKKGRLRLR